MFYGIVNYVLQHITGKLKNYLSDGNIAEARCVTHTLKGAAGTLGLLQIQENSRQMEEILHSSKIKGNAQEMVHLMKAIHTGQSQLNDALTEISGQVAS
jgi:chemotaxis protein histidine kinase CheA